MELPQTKKKNILLFIFLGLLSLSLLSPIASNEYLPISPDFSNHIVNIVEAKQALEEGQFPVRVAPSLYEGWRYPYYQFYSPFTYTVAGVIYKFLTPSNPFLAFKIILWFFLVVGGFYVFRLTKEFVLSDGVALLTSIIFLMTPYLLVDINARGDLTEAIAACIVPIILYYHVCYQRRPSLSFFLCAAFFWFVLATTHILIFLCSIIFIGLFIISQNIQESLPLKRLIFAGIAFSFGCLLALWYFVPIFLVESHLYAHYALSNPFYFNWLNPLSTLLSVSPVSPIPLPGNGHLDFPFYISMGWPILLAVGCIIYKKIMEPKIKTPHFVNTCLVLFLITFFLIWSPINFWKFLPEYCKSIQFGFRFMTQIMWMGALLFAWIVSVLFQNKLELRHIMVGILLIGIANGAWLQSNQSAKESIADLTHHPKLSEWGADAFVVRSDYSTDHAAYLPVNQTQSFCHQEKTITQCDFVVTKDQILQLPVLFYPDMLDIKVDGQSVSYEPIAWRKAVSDARFINPMLASIKLSPGHHAVTAQFTGVRWANYFSIGLWIIFLLSAIFSFLKASAR